MRRARFNFLLLSCTFFVLTTRQNSLSLSLSLSPSPSPSLYGVERRPHFTGFSSHAPRLRRMCITGVVPRSLRFHLRVSAKKEAPEGGILITKILDPSLMLLSKFSPGPPPVGTYSRVTPRASPTGGGEIVHLTGGFPGGQPRVSSFKKK